MAKQKKTATLNKAGKARINALLASVRRPAKSGQKFSTTILVDTARAAADLTFSAVATPTVESRDLPNFPFPNLDEADLPIGGFTNIDVTVLVWTARQHDARWDFMYRPSGTTVWRKPPIVAENKSLGMASIVLPQGAYEFLPLARV